MVRCGCLVFRRIGTRITVGGRGELEHEADMNAATVTCELVNVNLLKLLNRYNVV